MKQLGFWPVLGIWAAISLGGALFAAWQGYGGIAFASTVTIFSFLLLIMLLFAARGIADRLAKQFGPLAGIILAGVLFLAYIFYLVGTHSLSLIRAAEMAGFIFRPYRHRDTRRSRRSWLLARLPYPRRRLGLRQIRPFTFAVAVSRRPPRLRHDRSHCCRRGSRHLRPRPPR